MAMNLLIKKSNKKYNKAVNFGFRIFIFFYFFALQSHSQITSPTAFSGLSVWLTSDSVQADVTGRVSKWWDMSGNSNHSLQTNISLQPIKISNVSQINNKPLVRFDGVDDFLQISDANSIDFSNGFTVLLISKQAIAASTQAILCKWDYGVQSSWAFETGSSNGLTTYIANSLTDGGGNKVESINNLFGLDQYNILTIKHDGTQINSNRIKTYINTINLNTSTFGTISPSLINSTANLRIGSFGNLGRYFNGDFVEIIIYII